jgi:hypothetical protein
MEEEKDPSEYLNEKQKLFCKLFVSKEFFGNGTLSYCEAYDKDPEDVKEYSSARHSASLLLDNVNISKHINNLLEDGGLNDAHVDKRMLFLINQNEDKSTALAAIKEYNKIKGRTDKTLKLPGGEQIEEITIKVKTS